MAAMLRVSDPRTSLAAESIGRPRQDDPLVVEGVLPEGLDGCFVQAGPHPVAACLTGGRLATAGPPVFSGVRLDHEGARWLRAKMPVRRSEPLGPVPALAPSAWLAGLGVLAGSGSGSGSGMSDEPGYVSVARPVCEAGSPEWHTVASYPGLDCGEYLVADPTGTVIRAEPFALEGAPLMHAVALTRRFVVVFDLPVVFSRAAALVGTRLPYRWRQDRPARIGLLPRDGSEPRWFPIDPCYVFHSVNAYDDGDRVVVDAVWNASAFTGPSGAPQVRRWTLDLATGAVAVRRPAQGPEVAVVDQRVSGRRHRYMFGSNGGRDGGAALSCHDLAAGTVRTGLLGPGWRAGHPVFVPDPRRLGEGTGWIVVVARHVSRGDGELRVLDALDPAGPPHAVVRLPAGLPLGLRVAWLQAGQPGEPVEPAGVF